MIVSHCKLLKMADDDGGTFLLIDVQVSVGNRNVYSSKHFLESEDELYADTIDAVLAEYAATVVEDNILAVGSDSEFDPIKVETQALLDRIKSVKCAGKPVELYKFLQRSGLALKTLNSTATPIFKNGIAIWMSALERRQI